MSSTSADISSGLMTGGIMSKTSGGTVPIGASTIEDNYTQYLTRASVGNDYGAKLSKDEDCRDSRVKKARETADNVQALLGNNYNLQQALKDYEKFPERGMFTLEDAYGHYMRHDNNYLKAVLFDMTRGSHNQAITQYLLPVRFFEGTIRQVTVSTMIFDNHLMEELPTFVPAGTVTKRAEQRTYNLQRIGLSMTMEHDFMRTEEGRMHYQKSLEQIANALDNSLHLRAMQALVDSTDRTSWIHNPFAKMFDKDVPSLVDNYKFDSVSDLTSHILDREVQLFGAVHKFRGLDFVNKTILPEMINDGVHPNSILIPEHAINTAMFSPEVMSYKVTGLKANGTPFSDVMEKKVPTCDGLSIFTYRPFKIETVGEPAINPLYHTTFTGEYYEMNLTNQLMNAENYETRNRDIRVYNEDIDECERLKFVNALESALELLKNEGKVINETLGSLLKKRSDLPRLFKQVALKVAQMNGEMGNDETTVVGTSKKLKKDGSGYSDWFTEIKDIKLDGTNDNTWIDLAKQGFFVPVNLLILRPNIRHRMGSAVYMVAGAETGETAIGWRTFTLSDDGNAGVHVANFHCWTGSYVKNPKNVLVVPDIIFGGYLGGNTGSFYDGINSGDNVVLIQPIDDKKKLPVISLSGTFNNYVKGGTSQKCYKYSDVYSGMSCMKHNTSDSSFKLKTMMGNTMCLKGGQFNYDSTTNDLTKKVESRAHCGESCEGSKLVRTGRLHYGPSGRSNAMRTTELY